MKYLSLLITLPMVIVSLLFIISNQEKVFVSYWLYAESVEVPLYIVGLAMLCIGFLCGALFVSISFYALRHEHWKTKRRLSRLEAELLKQESEKATNITQKQITA